MIPAVAHVAAEYAAGVLLIVAPFVFDFDSGAATALGIVAGVALIAIAASTDAPGTLAKTIPVRIHVGLDFALAGLMIAAPFLFAFSDESTPTAFFIVLGVAHLLLTIGTRFLPLRGGVAQAGR